MNEQGQPYDWRGVPIEVGAIVVFPSRQSSSQWMNEGIVESIELEGEDWRGEPEWKIGVRSTQRQGWRGAEPKSGKVAYPKPDRLTVVGRPNPDGTDPPHIAADEVEPELRAEADVEWYANDRERQYMQGADGH